MKKFPKKYIESLKIRQLSYGLRQLGGRQKHGPITCPRRGQLVKTLYRFLDTKRTILTTAYGATIIQRYKYDPNRSAFLSLIMMPNGILTYILAADIPITQLKIYNLQQPPKQNEKGWSNFLRLVPLGSMIFNIESVPGTGAQVARSAGTFAVLIARKNDKINKRVVLKLKSGEHRLFSQNSIASMGVVSNHTYFLRDYRTAGTVRRYGFRPRVRPAAMNPVDHPMAGRTRGGCAPQNKNGLLSLGTKTARIKSHKLIITSARKSRLKK